MSDDLRDAITTEVESWYEGNSAMVADAILALPEMQARERVIAAAREWLAGVDDRLITAVAALDALEQP